MEGSGCPRRPVQGKRLLLSASSLGLSWAAAMLLLSLLGRYADRRTGGGWGWTLAGVLAGLLYGAYEVWKIVRESHEDDHPHNGGQ